MPDVHEIKQVDGGAWLLGLLPEGHKFKPSANHGSANNNHKEVLRADVQVQFAAEDTVYHFPAGAEVIVYRKYTGPSRKKVRFSRFTTPQVVAAVFLSDKFYRIHNDGRVTMRSLA